VDRKLIQHGKIARDSSAVLCITGNGLKTLDAVTSHVGSTREIRPSLREFEALLSEGGKRPVVAA
jgi:threonine synthase